MVDAIVAQRRAAGIALDAKDLLAYLMRAQASPGAATTITDKAIRDELMTMLFAGELVNMTCLLMLFLCSFLEEMPVHGARRPRCRLLLPPCVAD